MKYSRDRLKTNVTICSLEELPQNQDFDAVLLIHVIEHLRSPVTALKHIAGLLKPDGMFYVECPNLQAPFARRGRLFHYAHIHNYVPETLRQTGEASGFELQQRFGDDQDTNLQMLFRKSVEVTVTADPENVQQTLNDLHKADFLPYHLRTRYVSDRIHKVSSYVEEHLKAQGFVEDLVENCNATKSESRAA